MSFLIDTNIFIPLEPTGAGDLSSDSPAAIELHRLAQTAGIPMLVHPAQREDIGRDRDEERRRMRRVLFQKYPEIPSPPEPSAALLAAVGAPGPGTNDWVDFQLLAAVERGAVRSLVSHDKGLLRKARKCGLELRVLSLEEACGVLRATGTTEPAPIPAIKFERCHNLDLDDSIFDGFRRDYPEFDDWFRRTCLGSAGGQSRHALTIRLAGESGLAGIAILKERADGDLTESGSRTLKICSLRVSEHSLGRKLGELLLRAVFDFAHMNDYGCLFVDLYPRHEELIYLLETFGFQASATKDCGEVRMIKRTQPSTDEDRRVSAVEFHRRFGPYNLKWEGVQTFFVPIQPHFHARLFPDMEPQGHFFAGHESCGNTMLKAYICRAGTTLITPGDILAFYRSQSRQALTTLGVVEDTLRSAEASEHREFAAKRTVFASADLEEICDRGRKEALTVLFRHAPVLSREIGLDVLRARRQLQTPPQSIMRMNHEFTKWLQNLTK